MDAPAKHRNAQLDGTLARARDALPAADVTAAFAHGQHLDVKR